ncbi:MAG: hypothetical protein HRU19_05795 [Pseudobacteriovorax sp.]|nr:hypothetical protein [Pseudobacteriovorax sp.]
MVQIFSLLILLILTNSAIAKEKIPLNIGVGPSFIQFDDQMLPNDEGAYYGLKLDLAAVINQDVIKRNQSKIPKKYRSRAKRLNEVYIGHALIPDHLIVASNKSESQAYGIIWRPLSFAAPLRFGILSLRPSIGLNLAAIYLDHSDLSNRINITREDSTEQVSRQTFFFRPGFDWQVSLRLKLASYLRLEAGMQRSYYIPQTYGKSLFSYPGDDESSLQTIDEVYAMIHVRIPYEVSF